MNEMLEARCHEAGDFPATGTPQEKLSFLLTYAALAPSSHNSQPWRFRLCDDHVDLIADRSRALPIIDPQDRELIISCGAALGHLQMALCRFGYAGEVQTFPNPTDRDLLARIRLGEIHVPDAQDERLFQSLFARHTNRKPFRPERIPAEVLADLDWLAINSPLLIVLGSAEDTPAAWLATGQALSELLLTMTARGGVASFLNAPIEVAELRPRVAETLGHTGYPQMILRLGYSDPANATPRRPVTEVLKEGEAGKCL